MQARIIKSPAPKLVHGSPPHSVRRRRPLLLTAALLALLLLLLPSLPPAQTAEVQFTSGEYFLNEDQLLWRLDPDPEDPKYAEDRHYDGAGTTMAEWYFGEVAVQDTRDNGDALRFAVEALPDRATFRRCEWPPLCGDVEIAVRPDSGLLFTQWSLPVEEKDWRQNVLHNMNGWPEQRVGLSVADAVSGLKVYKDVLIKPPVAAPECHDYPAADEKRRMCQYNRENLPPRSTWKTTGSLLDDVADLLVQPKANYRLVFAEEFAGTSSDASSTEDEPPLAALDTSVWSYRTDVSEGTDSNDVPCGTVQDGQLHMARTKHCHAALSTIGKLSYQYGYLEAKFTLTFGAVSIYHNHAFVIGHPRRMGRWDWPLYGLEVDTQEEFLKHVEIEVDFLEFVPTQTLDSFNQYFNHPQTIRSADVLPFWSKKLIFICNRPGGSPHLYVCPDTVESEPGNLYTGQMTFVKGLEWTPRGYRTYIKVDGVHEDFILYPQDKTRVGRRPVARTAAQTADGKVEYAANFSEFTIGDPEHDAYFETWNGKLLEQVGVSHLPLELLLYIWAHNTERMPEDIRTKLSIDYIRIFKPQNNYADMEPIFQ